MDKEILGLKVKSWLGIIAIVAFAFAMSYRGKLKALAPAPTTTS